MAERVAIDRIYDALADDASFEALPGELAAAHGGRSTMIHWTDAGGTTVLGYAGCHTEEQLAVYARDFAARDPWVNESLRTASFNRAVDLETLVPLDQFTRTEFYNDYIRAMGDDTARCLGTMVRSAYGQGVVAIQRGKSQHGFNEAQVEAMDELVPHLRRMLTIRGRMAGMERRLGAVTSMLDALPQAALLVRSDGWIVESNAKADSLLSSGGLPTARRGHLRDDRTRPGLLAAIARACDPCRPTADTVQLGGGTLATVAPIKDAAGRQLAMLLVSEPPRPSAGLPRLKALYGLTDAEAAVLLLLTNGLSIAEVAEQRGVSQATIRAQFRAIADKMNCRRQAEVTAAAARVLSLG